MLSFPLSAAIFRLRINNTHHFNILLDASVANPPLILPVPKVLALRKIARKPSLLFQRLLEECIANAELAQNSFIINTRASHNPETDSRDSIV